ncbi:isoprenylcysteine carboxyl methyltransferase family protein [Cytobacillus sp. FJAT-54145]|uniref:Isoprenylcysteine carboxyl methyltransferase family protein n=1 Tax=Cytobacillus spartinae TaxID=3299023 RepID=A0ABW6KDB4_9BACI
MIFIVFISFIITQRLFELVIAKRNEKWMKQQGAKEFGRSHYLVMVSIHTLFFLFYIWEVLTFEKQLSFTWPILLPVFLLTQLGRIWAITSLGRYWNTKIIVLPNAKIIKKGPYQFLKHPNYVIVTIEFIILPLLFQAYITACLFTFLNMLILSIRIPAEEKALKELTEYESAFLDLKRFVPNFVKKV